MNELKGKYVTDLRKDHIDGWLEKLEQNLEVFLSNSQFNSKNDVEFIIHQYESLMLIQRSLSGQVIFVGAKPVGGTK